MKLKWNQNKRTKPRATSEPPKVVIQSGKKFRRKYWYDAGSDLIMSDSKSINYIFPIISFKTIRFFSQRYWFEIIVTMTAIVIGADQRSSRMDEIFVPPSGR